jgi:hypothetical protein
MRKRMEPILSKLPDRDNFHFYFAEAPFVVSGMDSVPLDEKAQLQLKNRSKDVFVKDAKLVHPSTRDVSALKTALQCVNLKRAVKAEQESEETRRYKRDRPNLNQSMTAIEALTNRQGVLDVESEAEDMLDQPSPNSRQSRMWLIHADKLREAGLVMSMQCRQWPM